MKKNTYNQSGFTLLELLVAAGVISFLSIIITQVLFSSMHLNTKTEVIKELKQTGDMALSTMSRMIQNSASVAVSVCDQTPLSEIAITGQDGGVTTLGCSDVGGVSRISSASASPDIPPVIRESYLTSDAVTLITNGQLTGCMNGPLIFTCVPVKGQPSSFNIFFQIRQKNLSATTYESAYETFQTTVSIRNTTNE